MIRGTLGFCCDIDANRLDSQPFSPPPVRTLKVSTALLHMGTSSPPTPSLNPSNHSWMGIGAVQLASALGIYCEERGIPAANILCFSNKEPFVNQPRRGGFPRCPQPQAACKRQRLLFPRLRVARSDGARRGGVVRRTAPLNTESRVFRPPSNVQSQ